MIQRLHSILTLALIYLIAAPFLLWLEYGSIIENKGEVVLGLLITTVALYAYSFAELLIISSISNKNSSRYVYINLVFSLLRLLLTGGLLLGFRIYLPTNYEFIFINILILYLLTLLHSTWRRKKENNHIHIRERSN